MKDNFIKKIIITMGIFLLTFTIVNCALFYITGGNEPTTLITCVFAACLGEGSICGFIKIKKKKEDGKISIEADDTIEDAAEQFGINVEEEEEDDGLGNNRWYIR